MLFSPLEQTHSALVAFDFEWVIAIIIKRNTLLFLCFVFPRYSNCKMEIILLVVL